MQELLRLGELITFEVLDSEPEETFDALVRAAAAVAQVPTAIIGLVDSTRQWFKAAVGVEACELPRADTLCDRVVRGRERVVVADARNDSRLRDHPNVAGGARIRFYAGFPLTTSTGSVLGTLCVADVEPRQLTEAQEEILATLADQVIARLELRRQLQAASEAAYREREMRERLAQSESLYRHLVEHSSDVIISRHTPDGAVTYVSPAVTALLGLPAASELGRPAQIHVDDDLPVMMDALQQCVTTAVPRAITIRARHADGKHRHLAVRLTPRRVRGRVVEVFSAARDVTEQVEAAVELAAAGAAVRAARDDLISALDAMPRSITLAGIERDGDEQPVGLTVLWANAYTLDRLGTSATDVVGRRFGDVFPDAMRSFGSQYLHVARTREPLYLPAAWYASAHVRGAFEITVVPWSDEGLLIDARDVTDKHVAEEALRISEYRMRDAQTRAGIGGWEYDLGTQRLTGTALFTAITGLPEANTGLSDLVDLVAEEDIERLVDDLATVLIDPGGQEAACEPIEFRIRRDGAERHLRVWGTLERDPGRRPVRAWGAVQDITHTRIREHTLTEAALTDPLTGLLNRRGWEARAHPAVTALSAAGRSVAVAVLDLDHFKTVNDTLGHDRGDALLRECGRGWKLRLRDTDVMARLGGEEFAVLLACDLTSARGVLEELRTLVPQPQTASVGVTVLRPEETLEEALRRADRALYSAKHQGRDRICSSP